MIQTRLSLSPAPSPDEEVPSPCRNLCELDGARQHCVGCGRTIQEVSRWSAMTAQERKAVLARLAQWRGPGRESSERELTGTAPATRREGTPS